MNRLMTPWCPAEAAFSARSDDAWRDWLFERGSMTQRVQSLGLPVSVQLLSQRMMKLTLFEQKLLGLGGQRVGLVREIFLCSGQQAVLFGRTVFSPALLKRAKKYGHRLLGLEPLGKFLFTSPLVSRGPLYLVRLSCEHHEWELVTRYGKKLVQPWARCSLYTLFGASFSITEIFLSDTSPPCSMA